MTENVGFWTVKLLEMIFKNKQLTIKIYQRRKKGIKGPLSLINIKIKPTQQS